MALLAARVDLIVAAATSAPGAALAQLLGAGSGFPGSAREYCSSPSLLRRAWDWLTIS